MRHHDESRAGLVRAGEQKIGHSLAGALDLAEGIPPLYAVTREILSAIVETPPDPTA